MLGLHMIHFSGLCVFSQGSHIIKWLGFIIKLIIKRVNDNCKNTILDFKQTSMQPQCGIFVMLYWILNKPACKNNIGY